MEGPLSGDRLLCLIGAENISTIDLVVEADFFQFSFTLSLLRFSVVDVPEPLTPCKYLHASSFPN